MTIDTAKADESIARPQPIADAPTPFDRFAALAVLTLFGVTWPVLDLLGSNLEFFLARRSSTAEIVVVAVVLTIVIPGLVGLIAFLPGMAGVWLSAASMVIVTASVCRLYLTRLDLSWGLEVGLALAGGLGIVWMIFHFRTMRQAARFLLVAPLVMTGLFFFATPVKAVLGQDGAAAGQPIEVTRPFPLVLLVFDEFPVAGLIDPDGNLRSDRYPNFARLAGDGIWYRNAVTVEQQTEHSVPAILTGSVPPQSLIPVAGQYPFNLFTALEPSYDLQVHESITQLCPRTMCEETHTEVSPITRDVSIVAGHILFPVPLVAALPDIDRSWGDFQGVQGDFDAREKFRKLFAAGQKGPIDAFIEQIADAGPDRPPLFYLHAIVPHHPWQFLPDGRSYPFIVEENPASLEGGWIDDDFLVAQSMQRHLLQVAFVDHELGEIVAALKQAGWYDEAMIVVVADHGIAIAPGVANQRIITPATVGDIAPVPLFVKLPNGESRGQIDDRRALTIDILPTIGEVIGAEFPDAMEGVSLLAPDPGRSETTTYGTDGAVTYGPGGEEKLVVAARIESHFPKGDPWALRPAGSPDLVGTMVDLTSLERSNMTTTLSEADLYRYVDLSGPSIPSRIGGELSGDVDGTEILAVSVNGVIGAVTRSYWFRGESRYLAMVPPTMFEQGSNDIEVLEVTSAGELRLLPDISG